MANAMYGKGREAFGNGSINWASDDIRAILIDTSAYTVNIDVHQYLSDIPGGARVGTAVALAGKTNTLGVMDCNDFSFTGLTSAPSIEALVVYKHTGTESTSPLLLYIDTATGLPVAAGATQCDVTVDNGANKLFKL